MEHRCYSRHTLSVPVEVWVDEMSVGCFSSRDISMGGVFLETGPVAPNPYAIVTLRFRFRQPGTRRRCAPQEREFSGDCGVSALVVHRCDEGIGLMYIHEHPSFYRRLGAVIRAAAPRDAGQRPERAARPRARRRSMRVLQGGRSIRGDGLARSERGPPSGPVR